MERTGQTVLIVDDDPSLVQIAQRWLESAGYRVRSAATGTEAFEALRHANPDVVCLDMHLPDTDGLSLLDRVRQRLRHVPVLMVTKDAEVAQVVEAMRRGAQDYLHKPLDRTRLLTAVKNAIALREMRSRIHALEREAAGRGPAGLIGDSLPMMRLYQQIDQVADSDITVLVHGESGSGKELVARAIHEESARSKANFVAINAAAIPDTLLESELFGHEKGAFTGAEQRKLGRFEEADHGTLFLDEVAELSLPLQAKLLRVLETHHFRRVGGTEDLGSDFRLVTATHQDLELMVREGRFREDLYYRIAVFDLQVPALRVRGEDVLLLARHFLQRFQGERVLWFSPAAEQLLEGYAWPGNVRELQNAVHRAVVAATAETIEPADFPVRIHGEVAPTPLPAQAPEASENKGAVFAGLSLAELERRAILASFQQTAGNVSEMARTLRIGRTTLYRKLREYGVA